MKINKNCGIYKITSPSGRIYIGQSVNIKRRWREYVWRVNELQTKLARSFNKYGIENHQFDIIEYCSREELDCSERFWQDEFDVMSDKGLNGTLQRCGEKRYEHSEETRISMSHKMTGVNNPYFGKKHSEEIRKKMSENHANFKGGNHPRAKKVIDIVTNEVWGSIVEASKANNIERHILTLYLNGKQENKTNLKKCHDCI